MNDERKHQIAFLFLMDDLKQGTISLKREFNQRKLGVKAKRMGLPIKELTNFSEQVQKNLDISDETHRNQMSYLFLKDHVKFGMFSLDPSFVRRELGNKAKRTGVPLDELLLFTKTILVELIDEVFGSGK